MPLVIRENIALVEYKYHRNAVGFSRSKKPINKGCAGLWVVNGDNKKRLVDISSNDMTLFAKILRLAYNVITAFINVRNERRSFLIKGYFHMIADSNRVGTADTFKAEIALNLAFDNLSIISFDGIPAAGVLDNEAFQCAIYTVMISFCFSVRSSSILFINLS